MNANWSDELSALDRVEPSRDLWADALDRAASPRSQLGFRRLSPMRPSRRRAIVLAATGVGLAGLAGLAAALVAALGLFSAPAAYAVTTNPNGTITVTLKQLSGLPALNREFARDGLPLKAVPMTAHCVFMSLGPPLPKRPFVAPESHVGGLTPTDTITLDTSDLPSGAVDLIGVSPATSGGLAFIGAGAHSPGPSCINSAAVYFPAAKQTPLPVSRGKQVTLVVWVHRQPIRRCTITVYDRWNKSGPSYAQGLPPKRPVQGRVSWTWTVATNTTLGKRPVKVTCGSEGSLRTYVRVTR